MSTRTHSVCADRKVLALTGVQVGGCHVLPGKADRHKQMNTMSSPTLTATAAKRHLALLHEERQLAIEAGLASDGAYMADLEEEIAACQAAFVGAAVTEIATLRAELDGPQVG